MIVEAEKLSPPAQRNRLVRWYTGTAIMVFNLIVLFVVVNLAIALVLVVRGGKFKPSYLKYSDDWYRKVYPGMTDDQWKELVRETKDRPFGFEQYTMFTDPAYHGQYVNVSSQGFRIAPDQGPWPIDTQNYNVFFFGGSTTEGYGVRDDQTVPVYFQSLMQRESGQHVCVYNFGRRGYSSTQERILFEQLLQDGTRPNLVVFIDGLNDFVFSADPAVPMQNVDELVTPPNGETHLLRSLQAMPIGQAAHMISSRLARSSAPPPPDFRIIDPSVITHYLFNKSAIESIARSYEISTVFVFQPTPTYQYDLSTHELKASDWDEPGDQCVVHGYLLMAQYVKDNSMGDDFLWLADVQKDVHKLLYVDKWHYNPEFAQEIAGHIYNFLEKRPEPSQEAQVGDAK